MKRAAVKEVLRTSAKVKVPQCRNTQLLILNIMFIILMD